MAVKTDSEIRRLEGSILSIQKQIDQQNETLREQTRALEQITINLARLNTCLTGVPDTEDTGLYGMVSRHGARIDRIEKILWPLVAVLIATNVVSVSSIFWG